MSKGFASNPRIAFLAGVILLAFAGLGVQLVNLHVLRREELVQYVERSRNRIDVQPARRGDILEANGRQLATSLTKYRVWADPQVLRERDQALWPELASFLGMPYADVHRILTTKLRAAGPAEAELPTRFAFSDFEERAKADPAARKIRYAVLKDEVDQATYDLIASLKIAGVKADRVYSRAYPLGQLAAHIVGFVNKAEQPAAGIEYFSNFFLHGRDGWWEGERDARGREMAQFRTRDVPATDGYSVRLSIDAVVQSYVEEELRDIARKFSPKKATIIVSDARTGFVLGLGNYPTFDPNHYNQADDTLRRNVALADIYEPGSVFKIVAAAGALEDRLVTPDTLFDCSIDSIFYNGRNRKLPGDDHPFKRLTVAHIITKSSNKGAVQLAMRLGDQRFYEYVRAFGFGAETGFPVGGEVPGMLRAPKDWDGATITTMPMGHAVGVTAMQMHQAMSVIASGGMLLRPQVIAEIRDNTGAPIYRYQRQEVRRVISAATARSMATMLTGVATAEGTAEAAAIPGFLVGGKTGTTKKIVDGKYSSQHHVASFVGFFPATRPEVVISVIVDDPDHRTSGGYGGKVAAPAFKHLAEQLIPYLDIKPVLDPGPVVALQGGRP